MLKIKILDTLPKKIEANMRKDLIAYETSHGFDVNYKRFSIILTDDAENALGVLNYFTAFAQIYIDDIWVHHSYRGKGYGKKLIQALEDHYKGRGFNNINLVTSAFQAPGFYIKCGFEVEFIRENKNNPQLTKTFFIKRFADKIQKQGIL